MPKFYKTTFTIDVLSEEPLGDCLSLSQIDYAIRRLCRLQYHGDIRVAIACLSHVEIADMLAALKVIVNECENMAEARTQARAAIAKAEGTS